MSGFLKSAESGPIYGKRFWEGAMRRVMLAVSLIAFVFLMFGREVPSSPPTDAPVAVAVDVSP